MWKSGFSQEVHLNHTPERLPTTTHMLETSRKHQIFQLKQPTNYQRLHPPSHSSPLISPLHTIGDRCDGRSFHPWRERQPQRGKGSRQPMSNCPVTLMDFGVPFLHYEKYGNVSGSSSSTTACLYNTPKDHCLASVCVSCEYQRSNMPKMTTFPTLCHLKMPRYLQSLKRPNLATAQPSGIQFHS